MNAEIREHQYNPMWSRIALWVVYFFIVVIAAYLAAFFTERNPLSYPNIPFPTDQEVYLPGEEVASTVVRCIDYPITYSFSSRLVRVDGGANLATLSGGSISVPVSKKKGENEKSPFCETLSGLRQVLPEKIANDTPLPSGDYRIEYEIFDITGRFRTHRTQAYTKTFRVERSEKSRQQYILLNPSPTPRQLPMPTPITQEEKEAFINNNSQEQSVNNEKTPEPSQNTIFEDLPGLPTIVPTTKPLLEITLPTITLGILGL